MRAITSILAGIFFIWYLSTITIEESYQDYFNKHLNQSFLYNDESRVDTVMLKRVILQNLHFDTLIVSIDSIKNRQDENTFIFQHNNKQIKLIAYAKKRKRLPL